jgi:hypothetical protein
LQIAVKRDAEVMAHGPGQKNRAGRLDLLGHIFGNGNRYRWNAAGFNRTLDQSDGLMADRSSRRE